MAKFNPAGLSLKVKDIMGMASDPTAGMLLVKKLLASSPYGMSNVLRLNDDGKIIFSMTGEEFDDIEQAIQKAEEVGIVNYTRLSPDPSRAIGRQMPFSGLNEERKAINNLLKKAKMNPTSQEAKDLRKLGMGHLIDAVELTTVKRKNCCKKSF